MIKAILFDIDNTLLDFDGYVKESLIEGFREFGLGKYSEEVYAVFQRINTELWKRIELGTLTYDELMKIRWNTIFRELGIEYDGVLFEKYFKGRLFYSAIPVEGAYEILDYLKDKYLLAVASNGPLAQQKNRLKTADMDKYFSYVFVSEEIGFSKPSREFFDYCIKAINEGLKNPIAPEEIMIVGDSLSSDIRGAIDSKIASCYFDRKGNGKTEGFLPDFTINKLTELTNIL